MPTARDDDSALGRRVGRLISSNSIPVGGFTPGAVLADRYRIIGLLGRGGMGEVYRSDDLKLGQSVALKFLPRELASDPVRRERFFAEVRITRQLSHPNICRVYDIAEVEGQHFLSMEYIDGEDLDSLIKRIGYLSNEKALEIARQLVAGLAAAHDRGVLHRDLKPANVMIDGRGRVRIMDFGLAIAAEEETQLSQNFGTPAYMAPEQFAGKAASIRSDIYALGLILYETYCGKAAFIASTMAELRLQKEGPPPAPSLIRQGLDPIVERLIMRCLDPEPGARPSSLGQMAAALPGGDPLAAAIAAGETPSPEMVAAAGVKEGLRLAVAMALMAVVLLGSLVAAAMTERTTVLQRGPAGRPTGFLVERARDILREAGNVEEPADYAFGFAYNTDFLEYVQNIDTTERAWDNLGDVSPILFWYRQSPRPLERRDSTSAVVSPTDPPLFFAGEARVVLDNQGRLRSMDVVPPEIVPASGASSQPDWNVLISEAGLDPSTWIEAEPQRNPSVFADLRVAWQGSLRYGEGVPARIEAASYHGKPVSFEIIGPWTRAERTEPVVPTAAQKISIPIFVAALTVILGGALFFAHRNIRIGRGDRRGATRVAIFAASLVVVSWLFHEHHVATVWEVNLFIILGARALALAMLLWVLYVALEPLVRRQWPQTLVSWTRLLAGEWRDPLVGRDMLAGCAAGAARALLEGLRSITPVWFGYPALLRSEPDTLYPLMGTSEFIAEVSDKLVRGMFNALAILFLLVLLRILLRNNWVAAAAFFLIVEASVGLSIARPMTLPIALAMAAIYLYVLFRFGFLSTILSIIIYALLSEFPITLRTSAWYFDIGFAALLVVMAIAVYSFRISLGNRRIIDIANIET